MNLAEYEDLITVMEDRLEYRFSNRAAPQAKECLAFAKEAGQFDTLVWALSHRYRVREEEIIRVFGEYWLSSIAPDLRQIARECGDALQLIDWLLTDLQTLAQGPVPGLAELGAIAIARSRFVLKIRLQSTQRCVPFVEGVAAAAFALYGSRGNVTASKIDDSSCDLLFKAL